MSSLEFNSFFILKILFRHAVCSMLSMHFYKFVAQVIQIPTKPSRFNTYCSLHHTMSKNRSLLIRIAENCNCKHTKLLSKLENTP